MSIAIENFTLKTSKPYHIFSVIIQVKKSISNESPYLYDDSDSNTDKNSLAHVGGGGSVRLHSKNN